MSVVQKQKHVSPFSSRLFSRLIAFTAAFLVFALLFGSMFQMFESISMQAMLRMNEEFSAQASTISDSMQSIINTLGIQMFYISSTAKLRKSTSLTQNERVFALRELWQYAMSGSMLHSIYVFNPKLDYVYTTDNDYMSASMDGFYDQDAVALYRRGDAYTYIRPQLLFAALGVLAMAGLKRFEKENGLPGWQGLVWAGGCAALALAVNTDYHAIGVLIICTLYLTRADRKRQCLAGALLFLFELTAPLAFVLVWFYNGQRGACSPLQKKAFYWFYPVHLLVLAGITNLML